MVTPGVNTHYTLVGADGLGCRNTASIAVLVSECTGLNQLIAVSPVSVYPNPANDVFTLKINDDNMQDGAAHIEITNAIGQTVYSGNTEVSNGELIQQVIPGSEWSKWSFILARLAIRFSTWAWRYSLEKGPQIQASAPDSRFFILAYSVSFPVSRITGI